ncbi:MAG TPA: response regulator transcription factor [Chthoniobacterales bacterium]|jgi:DNA-binding response OmpR family regulator|nr:response regulator transcription factor [Chthoniobacterales bacterium]
MAFARLSPHRTMHLLLIEDSPRLQRALGRGLRKAGYALDLTGDGEEGLWLAESNPYDVVILDLMLPRIDGLTLLRKLRAGQNSVHVLILTARDTVEDRVSGLQSGADDYLVKPFAFEELLARIQALCRRSYQQKNPRIALHDLEIDTAARVAQRRGRSLDLTPREFNLLEYLALRRGEVVSRTEIEAHIYPEAADLMSNAVDSAICILRKKITPPGARSVIQTRRGVGYFVAA